MLAHARKTCATLVVVLVSVVAASAQASTGYEQDRERPQLVAEQAIDRALAQNPTLNKAPGPAPQIDIHIDSVTVTAAKNEPNVEFDTILPEANELEPSSVISLTKTFEGAPGQLHMAETANRAVLEDTTGNESLIEGTFQGFRIYEVITEPGAKHRFAYTSTIDDVPAQFYLMTDGSVLIGFGDESDFRGFGFLEKPWAIDAQGRTVEAAYHLLQDGTTLELRVNHANRHSYPVVADPSYTTPVGEIHCSWGSCTFYLERVKTYWIRDTFATRGFTVGSGIVIGSLCTWLGMAVAGTGLGSIVASIGCAAWATGWIWDIEDQANQGVSCLTIRKYHVEGYPGQIYSNPIGHSSNSHCHYNA